MKLLITVFILLLAVSAQAQTFKFYWHDRWNSHEPGLFYFDAKYRGIKDGMETAFSAFHPRFNLCSIVV